MDKKNQISQNDTSDVRAKQKKAAEALLLKKLDDVYAVNSTQNSSSIETTNQSQEAPRIGNNSETTIIEHNNTYAKTYYDQNYGQNTAMDQETKNQWIKYHNAWQDYYKKYYEYYYTQELQKREQNNHQTHLNEDNVLNRNDKIDLLRHKIRSSMLEQATKVKKSQHFWPIASSLLVVIIFIFLQYNRLFIANVKAYITPAEEMPKVVISNPNIAIDVGPESRLIIPKINITAPVIYDIANDEASQQKAMQNGIAHFAIPGASSRPGEIGNTVLNGHSSNDVFDKGNYKFIFTKLDKLSKEDVIYADYNGKRYTYSVTKSEVVWPSEIKKLVYSTDKPMLTLITCTPIGTSKQRLLVTAEQISPNPEKAPTPKEIQIKTEKSPIPGNSPTLLQRFLDLFK